MTDEVRAYIWLTLQLNYNSIKISTVLSFFKTALAVWEADKSSLATIPGMRQVDLQALMDKDLSKAEFALVTCQKNNYKIITLDSPDYPERLFNILNPPHILYVNGDIGGIDEQMCIGVVGTRGATDYGLRCARRLGKGLASAGAVVVSGMARGIDTAAQEGAIKGNGRTIAVLGCGLDIAYPSENEKLMVQIAQTGAVVSEYIPGTQPAGFHFPVRNRIISGLSLGVVVVEADRKSGALITARHACEQGRDIFAIPGNIDTPVSEGCNALIKDGAILVTNLRDIVEEYIGILPYELQDDEIKKHYMHTREIKRDADPVIKSAPQLPADLTFEEASVMQVLLRGCQHIDVIVRECALPMQKVSSILMALELRGDVAQLPGKQFLISQNGE